MAFLSGKSTVILMKDVDVSAYFKEANASSTADEVDVTAFGATVRKFIGGMVDGAHSFAGFFEDGTDKSDDVLNEQLDDTLPYAQTIAPEGFTIGKRAFLLKAIETTYVSTSGIGDAVLADAETMGAGGCKWGQVLISLAAVGPLASTDTNSTGQDNPSDAATSKGAAFHLHVTANTTGVTGTRIRIQDSADNATFADVVPALTFTDVAAGATTSERIELANGNTLRRYVREVHRAVATGQTGTITYTVAYQRNF